VENATYRPYRGRLWTVDPALRELASAQANVVRRSQLLTLGFDRNAVRNKIAAERWRSVGSMVVVLHNGPLTRRQREWAAVLSAGRDAALAGRTALQMAGLGGWEDPAVHIITPRGRTPPECTDFTVVAHETRWPANGRLPVMGHPPRTRVERAAIDAAGWSPNPRTACGLVAAVVQQRLTTAGRLLETLDQAGPVRHCRVLALALVDIGGGAQALTEIDFARLCRKYKLGRVVHQAVRLDGNGKRRYLDVVIEAPSRAQVACEIDGAVHLQELNYWDDMSRSNELLISGTPLLRFPSIALRLDEARVADQVRRALDAQETHRHWPRAS
jgi:hypothetical protein